MHELLFNGAHTSCRQGSNHENLKSNMHLMPNQKIMFFETKTASCMIDKIHFMIFLSLNLISSFFRNILG